jgi:hypothetical protein
MPIYLDNSRSFTDNRSSRIMNQQLLNTIGNQPIGVALWNKDYKELPKTDNLILSTITSPSTSTYDVQANDMYFRRPRE